MDGSEVGELRIDSDQAGGCLGTWVRCDDRQLAVGGGGLQHAEIDWHDVAWARVFRAGDLRRGMSWSYGVAGRPSIRVLLLRHRPPKPFLTVGPPGVLVPTECVGASGLSAVLDRVITSCTPDAVDPSLLALSGLTARIRSRRDAGESSAILSAAEELDEFAVWDKPSAEAADDAIKAVFGCLAASRAQRGWALEVVRAAVALDPGAWDLRVCEAICLAAADSDAAALLAPALSAADVPDAVRLALEAQSALGVSQWFDPFV